MITLTIIEFKEMTGLDLPDLLDSHDTDPETFANITLSNWTTHIYRIVPSYSIYQLPDDDELSENQIAVIKRAIKDYALFQLFPTSSDNTYEMLEKQIIDDFRHNGLIRKHFGRKAVY